jgi:glycosyltransferase involved in cell wall biosynthesis
MKPVCVVSCPIDTFSGYGHRSRDFVRSLVEIKDNEWDIKIMPQVWGNTPWGFLDKQDPLKQRFIQHLDQKPDIWIQITVPNEFQSIGGFNIGVTAGIESTLPPVDFVRGFNRMDLNLVSSNFTKNVFNNIVIQQKDNNNNIVKEIRCEKPVEVLFEGLDLTNYFKKPENSDLLKNIEENFCFLYTGHWLPGDFGEDRKNVATLIETFLKTFNKRGPKPALLLKTNRVDYSLLDKEEILKNIRIIQNKFKNKENLPNIYLLHGEFTNEELNKINNDPKVKAFVSFTKGEGFGRPLLEQAITGKPVIVSNWSGHTDFIHPDYNILVGGELKNIHKSAANKFLLKEAQWFNINEEIASKAMKDLYKHYKKYIESSRKQTQYLKDNYSFEKMSEALNNYLNQINLVSNIPLQLPKLKKVESKPNELPKLKLPKLKIDG